MKANLFQLVAVATLLIPGLAHATCSSAAIWAAESEYGNDPAGPSRVKVITVGQQYKVTVGVNNVEDGAHSYIVTFKTAVCDPKQATITEIEN